MAQQIVVLHRGDLRRLRCRWWEDENEDERNLYLAGGDRLTWQWIGHICSFLGKFKCSDAWWEWWWDSYYSVMRHISLLPLSYASYNCSSFWLFSTFMISTSRSTFLLIKYYDQARRVTGPQKVFPTPIQNIMIRLGGLQVLEKYFPTSIRIYSPRTKIRLDKRNFIKQVLEIMWQKCEKYM